MAANSNVAVSQNYAVRFVATLWASLTQLVRAPSHSRRAEARRRSARHVLWLAAGISVLIIALMYWLDAAEIRLMPPRGTASLWWVRILTDFGKSAYVLWALLALLLIVLVVSAAARGTTRSLLLGLARDCNSCSSPCSSRCWRAKCSNGPWGAAGRSSAAKPTPFTTRIFPAAKPMRVCRPGHAITAFALAFAVSALWPQMRIVMLVYAVVIAASRLVLLAHHPSDVVAGALVGVIGAMFVRYWFAARRLGFAIGRDGTVLPLPGPSFERFKRVARSPFGP